MARQPQGDYAEYFDLRLKIGGEEGRKIQEIVKKKMKAERRSTLGNTVQAILLEYEELKKTS